MLRDEIANILVVQCSEMCEFCADAILALDSMKEIMEKARALDIIEYGFPQEVESALESARNEMKHA